jgi:Glutamine synthetase, beta-Grasp domain
MAQLHEDWPSTFANPGRREIRENIIRRSFLTATHYYLTSYLSHIFHPSQPCFKKSVTMKFTATLLLVAASQYASAFAPSFTASRPASMALNSVLTKVTGRSSLDPAVIARYDALPFPADTVLAEYVWVDAAGNTRSKTRTLPAAKAESVESLPKWNFDGSSTGQAPGDDSEVILRPCRIFKDPFRPRNDGLDNVLVMCDTWTPAGEPLPTNSRAIGKSSETWSYFLSSLSLGLFVVIFGNNICNAKQKCQNLYSPTIMFLS